ncbi:MAG: NAD(P)(+) transhydrogenase (Re/Si-specific) subunit alpha, partial [Stenotrophomonas sp.]
MAVDVLVLKETAEGERRVAATPETVKKLVSAGAQVHLQAGAGTAAGFPDQAYVDAGAQLGDALESADLLLCVQAPSLPTIARLKTGAVLVGGVQPEADPARAAALQARQLQTFP